MHQTSQNYQQIMFRKSTLCLKQEKLHQLPVKGFLGSSNLRIKMKWPSSRHCKRSIVTTFPQPYASRMRSTVMGGNDRLRNGKLHRRQVGDTWKVEPCWNFWAIGDCSVSPDAEENTFPYKNSSLWSVADLDRGQFANCYDYMETRLKSGKRNSSRTKKHKI